MLQASRRDAAKERHWRQVCADWSASELSIAEYCRRKDLVKGQMYAWHKRIKRRDDELAASGTRRRRMAKVTKTMSERLHHKDARGVEFAEVQVVERERPTQPPTKEDATTTLELIFPTGTRLRLAAGCALDLLESVINILEKR